MNLSSTTEFEMEMDEKLRLTNDLNKIQGQILN